MIFIKQLNGFGIFQNNKNEIEQYGFNITVLEPYRMNYFDCCSPFDTNVELDTVKQAESWIINGYFWI